MTKNDTFEVVFWGTRGTLATPQTECTKAGGNTVCVQARCGEHCIIFDAGTGIRLLGTHLQEQGTIKNLTLLLSHGHYDHIEGIPFFVPLFDKQCSIDIYGGHLDGCKDTDDLISGFMRRPYFPVGQEVFQADIRYHTLDEHQKFDIDKVIDVTTLPLNHPGGATAYKITYRGRSFAYVTDTEHVPGKVDQSIVDFIQGVDAFVYDASLTDEEYPDFAGYGHSTWQEGLRLAKLAKAKRYFAFHHMPYRCDNEMDEIERAIEKEMPGSGVARENKTLTL